MNKDYSLKQTCKSVFSIPTLFDYLLALKPDLFHKIKKLKIDDIPKKYYIEDDLIGLIEKYEKIKEAFDTNEIELIWKQYLNLWYAKKSIKQLEEVIDKMNSIQEGEYTNIIKEIKNEIIKKGKLLIRNNSIKSYNMYKFINKYKNI